MFNKIADLIISYISTDLRDVYKRQMLGEHTEEVLKEIGYTDEQIKAMEEKKAAVQIDTTQFQHLDEEM